eukprot:m.161892 g.161892  ORF g.161892 m.161892 type:complete len:283 (+) comp18061_c0_seq2:223-1071(+)
MKLNFQTRQAYCMLVIVVVEASNLTYYDASSVHPQCFEGEKTYIEKCVHPCDLLMYFRSAHPQMVDTLEGKSCTELGYEYVFMDPGFPEAYLYWKGGHTGWQRYVNKFFGGHTRAAAYLNYTRDHNPACSQRNSDRGTSLQNQRNLPLQTQKHTLVYESDVAAMYDTSSDFRQCLEGSFEALSSCAMKSDYFMYAQASTPTVVRGSCASVHPDFQRIPDAPEFKQFQRYWMGGEKGWVSDGMPSYLANHSETHSYLTEQARINGACQYNTYVGSSNTVANNY